MILVKNCFNLLFLFFIFKIIFSSCFRLFVLAFFLFPLEEVILQIFDRCSRSSFRGTETGSKINDDIIIIKGQQFSKKNKTKQNKTTLLYSFAFCHCVFVFPFSFPTSSSQILGVLVQLNKHELVSFFCVF